MSTTTPTLDLTSATPAELRAECDRLGITYRAKDDRKALARKIEKHEQSTSPETPVVDAPAETTALDRIARMKLASDESKAMKAWRKQGAVGTPPATPNLDALNAETESAPRKQNGAKGHVTKRAASTRASTPKVARYVEARDKMKAQRAAGTRRVGRKISDDETKSLIVERITAHADATCGGELLVARWVDGLSMERYRWERLWKEVEAERAAA